MRLSLPTILLVSLLPLLAACGADGPPEAPTRPASGVSITGEASVGVVVTN